ncbi:hypothetical protein TTHERM_01026300 (macronuclear) [Tetrahymena thermophila SB210]|uniref:Uncharacterized protein n=1 Tax=Tetrahymena thermophila (strain SB210) TaxID=312017 RepID=Q22CP9_TETTS|nr:hypothetical protein TTHERM_01026300 [Tetrahymena thermophila SB210]EAR83066.1 hypothetical protein TTHERM_01026300 [Tetrahymena thermophila SB210]|eukprot:XP_001030729.1 hypothetical protein TTHERM_01026300 [Tetrahymena thermophila SB210]
MKSQLWIANNQKENQSEVRVKNYIEEDSQTFDSIDPTHHEDSIYEALEQTSKDDMFGDKEFYQQGRISGNKYQNLLNNSQLYYKSCFSNHNLDSFDTDFYINNTPLPLSSSYLFSSSSESSSIINEEQSSEEKCLKLVKEPESSQTNQSEQSDSLCQEDCQSQSSKLTMNQLGQKSCEETKNLFILAIPYIISRLNGSSKEKCRWEYASQITGLQVKKLNSLKKFNSLLQEIEEKSERNPEILKTFRHSIVEILEHDYIKYATNQKDYKTQAILLKYLQPIKLITLQKSNTFSSVKYVNKLLEKYQKKAE